jgi:hypothetical protein
MKTLSLTIVILTVSIVLLMSIPYAWSDDDWNERGYMRDKHLMAVGVAENSDPLYKSECGDCHMAYPAGLLPARSWKKIMNTLADHFGENAEVTVDVRKQLTEYLTNNGADNSSYRRSKSIMRKLPASATPTRITELSFFTHEHNRIGKKMVKDNPDVGSLSNCNACHQHAESGSFSEREIRIPGYGRWDD